MSAATPVGRYAKTPYFEERLRVRLYSVEELCYLFAKNAYLLDESAVNAGLIEWLDTELALPELAHTLSVLLSEKAKLSELVGAIFAYVGYGQDREELLQVLDENEGLSEKERLKSKADYLAQTGKYALAFGEYETLLHRLSEGELALRSQVLHNMGVITAQMFLFAKASELFYRAYAYDRNEETWLQYLAAKRLAESEGTYLNYVVSSDEALDTSLALESRLKEALSEWADSREKKKLDEVLDCRRSGNSMLYYEEIARMSEGLKREYRSLLSE